MKILVACEFSGRVREAFRSLGHDAYSCDFQVSEIPSKFHIIDDVKNIIDSSFDLMIAHPPCTYLCVSGSQHWIKPIDYRQEQALEFVNYLLSSPIKKIALENPVGIISTRIRPPNQYISPTMFGSRVSKKTGLWLKNLPNLVATNVVQPFPTWSNPIHRGKGSGLQRSNNRSRTFNGIAKAMASQWSKGVSYVP